MYSIHYTYVYMCIPAILQECGVDLSLFINCRGGQIWFLVPALRFVGLLHIYTHMV